ncbi:uncharacterized protein DEA37_0009285 [Paragonimus westermani]|uniref:Uncharacterized protein n=1 Tax=Paragonimus westermani TaxID=34504 RepID=A0A5J4NJQ9_9TREM|nr:uncharacterized protein DEA37_0009285 [Paragonimus westermani]
MVLDTLFYFFEYCLRVLVAFTHSFDMPKNASVHVKYGMYEVAGIAKSRTHRFEGLKHQLETHGHAVMFEKIPNIRDIIEIIVNGEKVFECRISDLEFCKSSFLFHKHLACDGILDETCHKIVTAVEKAY